MLPTITFGNVLWPISLRSEKLVCPSNKIGKIDLFQVTHHGADLSNNPVLVHSIHPRVAVIDNGPRKGGEKGTYATLKATPGLETILLLVRDDALPETVDLGRLVGTLEPVAARKEGEWIDLRFERQYRTANSDLGADGLGCS